MTRCSGPLLHVIHLNSHIHTQYNTTQDYAIRHLFRPAIFVIIYLHISTFQLYIIRVQSKKKSWNVKRRFSEFFHLKQDLVRSNKNVSKYPFPAKVLFGSNFSLKLLEMRKKCLHSFLQNILGNQQLWHKNEISTFLNNEVSINQTIERFKDNKILMEI